MIRAAQTAGRPGERTSTGIGVALECATDRIDVLVRGPRHAERARVSETVGHGHTRRVTPLLARALEEAGVRSRDLEWIAVDLGPGSFTGVRVGLATAQAVALAGVARVVGASSLASLALAAGAKQALVVPLVPAGRSEVYAGFFRADSRGAVRLVAAPQVLALASLRREIVETRRASGLSGVCCLGPGVPRWRDALEEEFPGATAAARRFDGLSAADLAEAALSAAGPAAGLPAPGEPPRALYVRSAQAEERVRHRARAGDSLVLRPMESGDVATIAAVEREVFSDPWPESFFLSELAQPLVYARVAERTGTLAGYSIAWLGPGGPSAGGSGHLGNLAVVPSLRRRGVASRLLADLLARVRALDIGSLTLEVRVSNYAAQALYRAHGFRLAGLRRGYYRDTGEDAVVMEWRSEGL